MPSKKKTTTTARPGALVKPARALRKVFAERLKPPHLRTVDGKDVPYLYFNARGKPGKAPCTKRVFQLVEGRQRAGQPPAGLDRRIHLDFLVGMDITGTVVSVDRLPKIERPRHGMKVVEDNPAENVEMTVDPATGMVHVTRIPPKGVGTKLLVQLINLVDRESQIYPGQVLGGKYEVMDVAGKRVEIDPQEVGRRPDASPDDEFGGD